MLMLSDSAKKIKEQLDGAINNTTGNASFAEYAQHVLTLKIAELFMAVHIAINASTFAYRSRIAIKAKDQQVDITTAHLI